MGKSVFATAVVSLLLLVATASAGATPVKGARLDRAIAAAKAAKVVLNEIPATPFESSSTIVRSEALASTEPVMTAAEAWVAVQLECDLNNRSHYHGDDWAGYCKKITNEDGNIYSDRAGWQPHVSNATFSHLCDATAIGLMPVPGVDLADAGTLGVICFIDSL